MHFPILIRPQLRRTELQEDAASSDFVSPSTSFARRNFVGLWLAPCWQFPNLLCSTSKKYNEKLSQAGSSFIVRVEISPFPHSQHTSHHVPALEGHDVKPHEVVWEEHLVHVLCGCRKAVARITRLSILSQLPFLDTVRGVMYHHDVHTFSVVMMVVVTVWPTTHLLEYFDCAQESSLTPHSPHGHIHHVHTTHSRLQTPKRPAFLH